MPEADIQLPLYRSTETVRAAVIVGAGNGQVQIDFPRYGDDVPIIKAVGGNADVGDVYVVDSHGTAVMRRDEFNRRFRAASGDAPKESLGIIQAYAKVGYEAARAAQDGAGPDWSGLQEVDKMALTATARHVIDNPHATAAEVHEVWRGIYHTQGVPNAAASVAFGQLSVERKRATKVFRAVLVSLK